MINNSEIQKNIETSTKVGMDLLETNIKNLTALSNLQIQLLNNCLKGSVSSVESFNQIKDQKSFQNYCESLKDQTEKQITQNTEQYVSFFKDYAKQITDVLAGAKLQKAQ